MAKYSAQFLILFFAIYLNNIDAKKVQCGRKTELQMDYALAKLFVIGQKNVKFPENPQQLRQYCNEALRLFDSGLQYTKQCLNKFGQDASAVLLHSVGTELRSVCRTGRINKRARDLLAAAPCGNEGNVHFTKCYFKWIDKYMGIMHADKKMRIPMSCCNFHEYVRCVQIESEEEPKCTPKTIDFFVKWFYKVMDGILQLMCAVYDESNTNCDIVVRDTPTRNASQKRYQSILMPLINIAMSLGDE